MKANRMIDRETLVERYLSAKELVIDAGFADEIDWQDGLKVDRITESDFLRETAWVILSSGMRESVVRNFFPRFSRAFCNWSSAFDIVAKRQFCVRGALRVFSHRLKVTAIADAAESIHIDGFGATMATLRSEGIFALRRFAFVGPVTVFHLAKNLGMDVVKPDRHLVRICSATGYNEPRSLCGDISVLVGDRLSVVDLVLWRFATLRHDYRTFFSAQAPSSNDRKQQYNRRKAPAYRGKCQRTMLGRKPRTGSRVRGEPSSRLGRA